MPKVASIEFVKSGTGTKGPWTLFKIKTDDGKTASSFEEFTLGAEVTLIPGKPYIGRDGVQRTGWNAISNTTPAQQAMADDSLDAQRVIYAKLNAIHDDVKRLTSRLMNEDADEDLAPDAPEPRGDEDGDSNHDIEIPEIRDDEEDRPTPPSELQQRLAGSKWGASGARKTQDLKNVQQAIPDAEVIDIGDDPIDLNQIPF